jgi:maltooligosyltrehalose trehalohydrolase
MSSAWSLERGARTLPDGSTHFSVWAPAAERVDLAVDTSGGSTLHPMEPGGGGVWRLMLPDCPEGTDYSYRLNGSRPRPDPVSRLQPHGVHGPSRVVDPSSYIWRDEDWRGVELLDVVLYELHVGTFTPDATFEGVARRLDYLAELGVTAIELMPVAAFAGRRNWGYDGVHPYAPHAAYGGPADLRRLVDAAHARGLAVFLDVVYNHLGPEGNYLGEFGPYFTDRYGTPWGFAINFDGPESDEVRRYFIDNALYWVTEYHIDGLRLDAVQTIFDFGARHILEELAVAVHRQASTLGRRVLVIAESDLNDPRLVRPRELGGYALDAMWNDDFHHAIHAALTGERDGYYMDFGQRVDVAKSFRDAFVLDGRYSEYRRRRHGAPADNLPGERFVVFIQNHDQVGNRARGERLDELVTFPERKLAAALLLLSPYVPLLFMGEEYGERAPFLYFVDHGDAELLEAVRRGRAREFERFDWHGSIANPGAQETFNRSVLDMRQASTSPHAELLRLYRDLLSMRRAHPALRPGRATVRVQADEPVDWMAAGFEHLEERLMAVFNLVGREVYLEIELGAGRWSRLLATGEGSYGGGGTRAPAELRSSGGAARLTLGAHEAALFAGRADR